MHADPDDPSTVADGPVAEDGGAGPLYVLRVSQGSGAGSVLSLDWSTRSAYLVGQGPLCDLRLDDRRVSRRHLSIAPEGTRLRVTDLGSRNGTRVQGVLVVEALLAGGEAIQVGDTELRVARTPAAVATRPRHGGGFGRMIGASFDMQRLFDLAEKLSASHLAVVIEGETGTGKELLAEAIHEAGPRANGPLVFADCAGAVPEVEAALFGGVRPGALEQAHGGTLVLSELCDLDLALQARLLPIVEGGLVRSAEGVAKAVDVRFVSTTRRDVDAEVQEGRLREDLAFRLAGARLGIPPLRRRHGDVWLLATHFWRLYGGEGSPPKALLLKLQRGAWPGNVRELQAAVARSVSAGGDAVEGLSLDLGERASRSGAGDFIGRVLDLGLPLPRARQRVARELERRYVARALAEHAGNVTRAAAASGLTRRYFHILLSESRQEA